MSNRILIVEDERVIRTALKRFLEKQSYKVEEAGSVDEASRFDLRHFGLIITDLRLPGETGTAIIPQAGATPVLVMTSYASVPSAVKSMKLGAADYIAKPFDYNELLAKIEGLILLNEPEPGVAPVSVDNMLGQCKPMRDLFERIAKVAPTSTNVLITGESGTGKELVARAIHTGGRQGSSTMISLNCAAIPESLIESELFGHEKGAFTGATVSRVGLVEAADNGTLFLDEIGELPLEAQARLLRVLQEGEVRRVGSISTRKVNVRLIAATHRDLKALTQRGEFREDLYYRLNVVKLFLPPLRERQSDVEGLAQHFLERNCRMLEKPCLKFAPDAITLLHEYDWPGNIRELENAVERAVILCEGQTIEPELLSVEMEPPPAPDLPVASGVATDDPDQSIEGFLKRFVLTHQDTMTETELAQRLGISRKSLWEKRQKLSIPRERSRKRQ